MPRLQPALFDVSRLAPLSSSAQRSLVRLNQRQRRSLAPSATSFFRAAKLTAPRRFVPRASRSGSQFTSARSISRRVAFLHDEIGGDPSPIIGGYGSEGGKRQVMFLPLSNGNVWHLRRTVRQVPSPSTQNTDEAAVQKCARVSH